MGRPLICRPGQTYNVAYSLSFFGLEQGWRIFFMARAQISDNFRRNTFACGKPEFTNTIFSDYFIDW
jgi:hypothetical protein